jgi:uncharacterized membrane protein YraQ (UPF0718 family)
MEFVSEIGLKMWFTLCEMAPYILFGFFAAGVLSVLVSPQTVERHLGGRSFFSSVKAALFGVPLPLCSCSVIPVTVSLRKHGAGRAAATAFLLSTPQTGVDSIVVTYSLLGPVFAIFRPIVAFLTGILGGMGVALLDGEEPVKDIPPCEEECCSGYAKGKLYHIFHYGFITLGRDIARPLVAGILIAGLIAALVPDNFFSDKLGTGIAPMLVMLVIGIPMYVCSTASVPIAASLIAKGISPGAALVFLVTGAATNAAGIATVWKIMGRKTAVIYLATVAVSALISGFVLDYLFGYIRQHGWHMAPHGEMLPDEIKVLSALVLCALLIYVLCPSLFKRRKKAERCCNHSHEHSDCH